ncbi:MAG: hypothetical protein MRY79_06365 [Alphaproteobacteria bacterium]|nr:hypothetical protein [Alphaproteobacteria bacterium]
MKSYNLPSSLALWIPLVAFALQILMEIFLSGPTLSKLHSENSLHETLQALLMALSCGIALSYFFMNTVKTPLLITWFGLAALCCFYVAGEEISWGQHLLGWVTPENWSALNDQGETNLHNTTSWLDQKPRLVLLIGILMGTFVFPLLQKNKWIIFPVEFSELFPPKELYLVAGLIIVPQIIEKIFELFDIALFARYSEVQELYIFYFVTLYVFWLRKNVMRKKSAS